MEYIKASVVLLMLSILSAITVICTAVFCPFLFIPLVKEIKLPVQVDYYWMCDSGRTYILPAVFMTYEELPSRRAVGVEFIWFQKWFALEFSTKVKEVSRG